MTLKQDLERKLDHYYKFLANYREYFGPEHNDYITDSINKYILRTLDELEKLEAV